MSYYTKITKAGLAAITTAMNNNSKVPITYMAFGDGNGYIPEPDENATSLVNEVYRVGVNKVEVHNKNQNWLVCEAIIPSAVGGFNIREVALYDSTGNTMLAIASYPPTYKPTVEEGAAKIQTIRIVIQVDNSGNFELIVDPDVVLATLESVEQLRKDIQKNHTTVINTIEDLHSLEKWPGRSVYVKGYYQPENFALSKPYFGGGLFDWIETSTLEIDNGIVFGNVSEVGRWIRSDITNINPFFFGAKGNGEFDDRLAFQKSINYLHSIGGGELFLPRPPLEYKWKTYNEVESACLVIPVSSKGIYTDPICIRGEANITPIVVDLGPNILIDAAIKLKGGGLYKKFENLSVFGGPNHYTKNCKRLLDGYDAWYPNLTLRDCRFYIATEECVRLATYVSVLDKVQTAYSPIGTKLEAPGAVDAPITSITMNSCYGLNHTRHALWVSQLTYSTINSHAADHIINDANDGYEAYPYYIDIARGVTINGLGAESSTRILKVRSAQGLTINGIMTLSIGDSSNPPNNLIRIDGGYSTTISGVYNHELKGTKKVLSLGSSFQTESVTILDDSIHPSEVEFTSNWSFERPIRFLRHDFSRKTNDILLSNTGNPTTNTTNFINAAKLAHDTQLLHDVIIRFPSGDFEINGLVSLTNLLSRGEGNIRLIGHSDGTSRVVAKDAGGISFGLQSSISTMNFTLENIELNIGAVNTNNKGFLFYKGITKFIKGKLSSDNGFRQYFATVDAVIKIDSESAILTPVYGSHKVEFIYKSTNAPTTSTRLPVGTTFMASNPSAERLGWINTLDNGLNWIPL